MATDTERIEALEKRLTQEEQENLQLTECVININDSLQSLIGIVRELNRRIDLEPEVRTTPWKKIEELEAQFSNLLKHLNEWKYPVKRKKTYRNYE